MTKEYATLRELDVQPGDVVESMAGTREVVSCSRHAVCQMESGATCKFYNPIWRIVSRASDTTKLLRDMTPEEKGALRRPKRETVELPGYVDRDHHDHPHFFYYPEADQTHRITFDLIDGKPDLASIKMEEL